MSDSEEVEGCDVLEAEEDQPEADDAMPAGVENVSEALHSALEALRVGARDGGDEKVLLVHDILYHPPVKRAEGEIVLLGRRRDGAGVVAHVQGWCPYLFVPAERGAPLMWQRVLNDELLTHLKSMQQGVHSVHVRNEAGGFGKRQGGCVVQVIMSAPEGCTGRAASAINAKRLRAILEETRCVRVRSDKLVLEAGTSRTTHCASVGNESAFYVVVEDSVKDVCTLDTRQLQDDLEELLPSRSHRGGDPVVNVELVPKKMTNIMGYQGSRRLELLKVSMRTPALLVVLRDLLEEGLALALVQGQPALRHLDGGTRTFESNVDTVLQFLSDQSAGGCQWVTLRDTTPRETVAQRAHEGCVELDVPLNGLVWEQGGDVGDVRVLSFDIEAAGRRGVFPQAQEDPVIQIACQFAVGQGLSPAGLLPVMLSWKECLPIEGATVLSFETEEEMLLAFAHVVRAFDADVLTGYNVVNFDFEYLFKRAKHLGVDEEFNRTVSRLTSMPLTVRESFFQSAQMGKRKRNAVCVAGRVVLDVFVYLTTDSSCRLDSYTLNSVSEHFLGDQKVDLPFTQITPLWHSGAEGRRTLGVYCLKDALLPLQLMQKLNVLLNVVEMARATGLPANWVLSRGLLIRFWSLVLRRARAMGFVVPYVRSGSVVEKGKFEGATVLPSVPGLHRNVAVLDFSSMYPSIIIAHNFCFSTFVPPSEQGSSDLESVRVSPTCTNRFVRREVQEGVLPAIVRSLVQHRARAKEDAKRATSEAEASQHNARQTAFKILGNSMYGAMGSMMSKLPFRVGSESVTAVGRRDIAKVKHIAETFFGVPAVVVAGDTDSIMVVLPVEEGLERCFAAATSLVEAVNAQMEPPKKMALEKICSILIVGKKRYCMLKHEAVDAEAKIDIKGMECVRRDGCNLVRDTVKKVLESLVRTGDVEVAAALAREALRLLFEDRLPLEAYVISKVLRKGAQECSFPMPAKQLAEIRRALPTKRAGRAGQPLSYEEQDEALQHKVPLVWSWRIRLPHVDLAYRLRCRDPGSAPVLGERVHYVVTNNQCKRLYEKVQTPDDVQRNLFVKDREYYCGALLTPVENVLSVVALQQAGGDKEAAKKQVQRLLWPKGRPTLSTADPEKKRLMLEDSPLARCFKRQRASNP